jgi:hypothetical protein
MVASPSQASKAAAAEGRAIQALLNVSSTPAVQDVSAAWHH